jgi:hypothetical protein
MRSNAGNRRIDWRIKEGVASESRAASADEVREANPAKAGESELVSIVTAKHEKQTSAEPLDCCESRALRWTGARVASERSSDHDSALWRASEPTRRAVISSGKCGVKPRPNQAPEPTTLLVTRRADARHAPSMVVAHL